MNRFLDAFWRAAVYCLHPRIIMLSLLPVVIMGVLSLALGYFYWEGALTLVREQIGRYELVNAMVRWLEGIGLGRVQLVLAPALLLAVAIPVVVIGTLLAVTMLMTPSIVALVASGRFAHLEMKKGGSLMAGIARSLGSALLAALALLVSIPLWLVPPLILILPPLIWGWLTYRVMSYDALAEHASREEREQIFRTKRLGLLGIGVLSGYLSAAPSLLWASGVVFIAMAPILVPLAIWIYTLVFAFSSLWFAHYCLAELEQIRKQKSAFAQAEQAHDATDLIVGEPLPKALSKPGEPPDSPH